MIDFLFLLETYYSFTITDVVGGFGTLPGAERHSGNRSHTVGFISNRRAG